MWRGTMSQTPKKDNMSTLVSDLEKRLYQVNVLEKAVLLSQRQSVRTHAVATGQYLQTYDLEPVGGGPL